MHLERLDTSRLRATWVKECAERIGLKGFMAAAGITCSQRLGDVVVIAAGTERARDGGALGGDKLSRQRRLLAYEAALDDSGVAEMIEARMPKGGQAPPALARARCCWA